MVSIIRILVFFMFVFPAFIFSFPLFGYTFSSLSKEQSEKLLSMASSNFMPVR